MRVLLTSPHRLSWLLTCRLLAGVVVSVVQVYMAFADCPAVGRGPAVDGVYLGVSGAIDHGRAVGRGGDVDFVVGEPDRELCRVMNFVVFPVFFLSPRCTRCGKMQNPASGCIGCAVNPFSSAVETRRFALWPAGAGAGLGDRRPAQRCCWRWPFAATGRASWHERRAARVNAAAWWGSARRPPTAGGRLLPAVAAVGKPQHLAVAPAPRALAGVPRHPAIAQAVKHQRRVAVAGAQPRQLAGKPVGHGRLTSPWPTLGSHTLPGRLRRGALGSQWLTPSLSVKRPAGSTSINSGRGAPFAAGRPVGGRPPAGRRGSSAGGAVVAQPVAGGRRRQLRRGQLGAASQAHGQQRQSENRRMAMLLQNQQQTFSVGKSQGAAHSTFVGGRAKWSDRLSDTPACPIGGGRREETRHHEPPRVRRGHHLADVDAAVDELHAQLDQADSTLVLNLCLTDYHPGGMAASLNRRFADTLVVGCTTAGEIGPGGYHHSISAVRFAADFCRGGPAR